VNIRNIFFSELTILKRVDEKCLPVGRYYLFYEMFTFCKWVIKSFASSLSGKLLGTQRKQLFRLLEPILGKNRNTIYLVWFFHPLTDCSMNKFFLWLCCSVVLTWEETFPFSLKWQKKEPFFFLPLSNLWKKDDCLLGVLFSLSCFSRKGPNFVFVSQQTLNFFSGRKGQYSSSPQLERPCTSYITIPFLVKKRMMGVP